MGWRREIDSKTRNRSAARGDLGPEGHDFLALFAETVDAEPHRHRRPSGIAAGFMPMPTPGGVPVAMTSPGTSVMKRLI